jgi:peptide/nickel transport system substrate-binding protein
MMNKRLLLALAGATLLTALAPVTPAQAFERAGDRKIIVFAGRQQVPVLDPHVRYDWSTRMMQQAVYDALAKYTGNPAKIEPWLAERWESSADAKTWTFHLVKNARFHNGDPVDAEAVRYSFERGLKLNKGVAWMLKDFLDPGGIEVVDTHAVRFKLKSSYAPFLGWIPWWYIVNPKQVKANEAAGDYGQKWLTENSAGSGPFKQGRWQQNVLHELTANEGYWKGWPMGAAKRPAGVIYRIVREPAAQKAALQRGEADIVEGLTPDDYETLLGPAAKKAGIVVQDHVGMTTFGIKFNTQNGPTKDINLRRAIAHAVDYEAMLKIYNGAARLETSPFPQGMRGHIDVADRPVQDLKKAKEFLAKSAYPNGGIELDYYHVAGLEEARRIGLVLLLNLQKLDIKVNVIAEQWPNMVARGSKPDTSPHMTSVYVTPISTDPDSVAYQYHRNAWGQYFAMSHYDNPSVNGLIDQARGLGKWEERAPLYAQIQKQIMADVPEVFGMIQNRRWAHRDYLKGFQFSPVRFTGEVDLYQLWIDAK